MGQYAYVHDHLLAKRFYFILCVIHVKNTFFSYDYRFIKEISERGKKESTFHCNLFTSTDITPCPINCVCIGITSHRNTDILDHFYICRFKNPLFLNIFYI